MRVKVEGIDSVSAARDRDIEFLNKKIQEAIGIFEVDRS